jgi:hypothetical protein
MRTGGGLANGEFGGACTFTNRSRGASTAAYSEGRSPFWEAMKTF